MSNMICFDRSSEAKKILKKGIGATSARARSELWIVAWYLLTQTIYSPKQIEDRLRAVSADYFKGMTEGYINQAIQDIVTSVRSDSTSVEITSETQPITIYKEELDKIASLKHDDTERLAFVFLCVAKMKPYSQIYECNSELYRLAWRYKYDAPSKTVSEKLDKRRVGGNEPTRRVNQLCQAGIVKYFTRINSSYNLTYDKAPASTVFSVPIIRGDGNAAFTITNPDADSLVLWYDRYKGYNGIITCENCSRPVMRTGRRQKYCSSCNEAINHRHKKRLYGDLTA